jgi:hypothetical protein
MKEVNLKCRVTGHSTGPLCDTCGSRMDSILVLAKKHVLSGKEASYCYRCTFKRR